MKLQFDVTLDDLVEFQRHFYTTSKPLRRQQSWIIIGLSAFAVATSLLVNSTLPVELRLVIAALFIVPLPLFFRLVMPLALRFGIRRLLNEDSAGGMLGRRDLTADEDGLTEITDVNETRHRWPAITQVDETDTHDYLFISALQAHVIPKDRIFSGNLDEFLQFAREMVARHATGCFRAGVDQARRLNSRTELRP